MFNTLAKCTNMKSLSGLKLVNFLKFVTIENDLNISIAMLFFWAARRKKKFVECVKIEIISRKLQR